MARTVQDRRCLVLLLAVGLLASGCGRAPPRPPTKSGPATLSRPPNAASRPKENVYQIPLGDVEIAPVEKAPANTVGICFCLDVSPSMKDRIGGRPKLEISKEAMRRTFAQLAAYAQEHPEKRLLVGLVVFGGQARVIQKLEPFDKDKLEQAIQNLPIVEFTGVGQGMLLGLAELVQTPVETRAMIVLTDGENNTGVHPEEVVRAIKSNANSKQALTDDVQISLVAFDVNAGAFAGVKRAGASVVESRDQKSLEELLRSIVEDVLLEAPGSK